MENKNYSRDSINEIAKEVIDEIRKTQKDPFVTPILVFHNMKVAQWFKAYFLKECDDVLMNVRFVTLPVFINGVLNPERKYTVMDKTKMRDCLLEILLDPKLYHLDKGNPQKPTNYIFYGNGSINGINLFEFAEKMASLFMQYEMDEEEIEGWERDLYERTLLLAKGKGKGCYTAKELFDLNGVMKAPEGPIYIIDNSYTTKLYSDILTNLMETAGIRVYSIKKGDSEKKDAVVFSAPSRLREVEAIHTYICQKVQNEDGLRFNDFLVYAPGIGDYANEIRRVFRQDNVDYPTIPFRIAGEIKEKKDMTDSLSILFDIANKRFFTRKDFYDFIKNPMIEWAWNIEEAEAETWEKVVLETNTYRNGERNDWENVKKRMLISLLVAEDSNVENITALGGEEYLPYSSMDLDQSQMNKMVQMIDALSEWCGLFSDELKNLRFDRDKIEEIREKMNRLYSRKNKDGEEKNYYYREIVKEIEQIAQNSQSIPADTFLRILLDTPNAYSVEAADLFTGGVTFMELSCDDIVAAKYISVMGVSSRNYPRKEIKSELDESKNHVPSKTLDKWSIDNICKNAEKGIRFSFVDRDLKTEEEFYPSTLIKPFLPKDPKEIRKIPLDETRAYGELYTDREFRNKNYIEHTGEEPAEKTKEVKRATFSPFYEDVFKTSDIKAYLKNTFVFKFEQLMKAERDDTEKAAQEYEPFSLNGLEEYTIRKGLIKASDKGKAEKRLKLENSLPMGESGVDVLEHLSEQAEKVREEIKKGYELLSLAPLQLKTTVRDAEVKWSLILAGDVYRKEDGKELFFLEPVDHSKKKPDKLLGAYAVALMDVASRTEEGAAYQIHLGMDNNKEKFSLTRKRAREILGELYRAMTDYEEAGYMDVEFIDGIVTAKENKRAGMVPKTIQEFNKKIEKHESWKYFGDKQLIEPERDFGYDVSTVGEGFKGAYKKLYKLIQYYEQGNCPIM